ncbi:MAG: putative photosynthetic complex assembly protein PuhE [Chloroflexota bacterium]
MTEVLSMLFPVLYAVFLWWFTTGLIIAVFGRSQWILRVCFGGATLAMLVALISIVFTRHQTDLGAVYAAVAAGIVIWGWQVAGYYLNFITGKQSRKQKNPMTLSDRFWAALQSSLHHELVAVGFGIVLFALTWNAPNRFGLWMYIALWAMHASAKLNVFFGVRNFRIEFLPQHMQHLGKYLSKRDQNEFFPFAVVFASALVLVLLYQAIIPEATTAERAGYLMIATMMTLGLLEHWLLVLPVPAALWGWGIRSLPDRKDNASHIDPPALPSVRDSGLKG